MPGTSLRRGGGRPGDSEREKNEREKIEIDEGREGDSQREKNEGRKTD